MNTVSPQHVKTPLTAVIIAKNEARHIHDCIVSVQFADEILVVDSGSDDDTVFIAEQLGAHVRHQPWLGYGPQKRMAVGAATFDWVLCLDADERVDPLLAEQIQRALTSPAHWAYELPMQQKFMNRMLRYGDGYPLWKLRLFHRNYAQWSDDPIHESVLTTARVGRLRGKLLHVPQLTLGEWIQKQNGYTTLQATYLRSTGVNARWWNLVLSPAWRFLKYYVVQRGFLDGVPGLVHAALSAAFVCAKYAKLWLLNRQ